MTSHPMRDALPGMETIHLTILNRRGSVEHYYHFLLGFLIPLVIWHRASGSSHRTILIRSCGPLDGLIRELGHGNLLILDRDEHFRLLGQTTFQGQHLDHVRIEGYDWLSDFDASIFRMASQEIARLLGMDAASGDVSATSRPARILLVGRAPSHPFYESDAAEINRSGAARRTIPNLDQTADALSRWCERTGAGVVNRVYMEGRSLREQIHLFRDADVVIAQHGASLANLIFCRPGTGVIEWLPNDMVRQPTSTLARIWEWISRHVLRRPWRLSNSDLFPELSRQMGLRHLVLAQDHSHAPVRIDSLLSAVGRLAGG